MKIEIDFEVDVEEARSYLISCLNKDGGFYDEDRDKIEAYLPSEVKEELEESLIDLVLIEVFD